MGAAILLLVVLVWACGVWAERDAAEARRIELESPDEVMDDIDFEMQREVAEPEVVASMRAKDADVARAARDQRHRSRMN